jgi:23S rRNA (uracil1939-C5)-methyltransferase
MMTIDDPAQRDAKLRFLLDALHRIGRLPESVPVDPVTPAPATLSYRNKLELTFGGDVDSRPVLGFHRADGSTGLVDVDDCSVADPTLRPLLAVARAFFLGGPGSTEPATRGPIEPLRLVLRTSHAADERIIAFRGLPGPFPSAPAFAQAAFDADPGLVGVVRLLAARGRRGGATTETILGRAWITERIHGISFNVPAGTFLQIHPTAAERLFRHVLDGAAAPRSVVELYGGIGALGLALAKEGARATIVDADPSAIACGLEAARSQGLSTATFERADVLEFLARSRGGGPPELVIADPPRTGLGRGVAERLAALAAPRIAMVSCDPATLARDLAALSGLGYRIDRVAPFDLFPQTAHVEAVAWLSRGPSRRP